MVISYFSPACNGGASGADARSSFRYFPGELALRHAPFRASTCPSEALATRRCEHATARCELTSVRCDLAMRRCELTIRHCDLALCRCDLTLDRCDLTSRRCDLTL